MNVSTAASFWVGNPPREGFTEFAAKAMRVAVPIDAQEVSLRAMVQRQHLLSALQALRHSKRTAGICHANAVGNN